MGICLSCRRRERKAPEKRAPPAAGPRPKGAAADLLPRRDPAMANSISNIKMTNPIKGIVSKRRKRYMKDGFNLDLAYITDRLIAMGFPAEKLEGVYRNHIDEVARFLDQMHKDHYRIYNLCSERSYDSSKFHERVVRYAFDDHTPPNIELIIPFCEDVHSWLSADPRNVAAVHCKAGKGRTGTMVCCYLLYSGQKATADEALKFYGTKRTHDEKGVTIPSQRRYVEYYAALLRSGLAYQATKVHIRELVMTPPPALNGSQCTIELTVMQASPPLKAPAGCLEVRKSSGATRVALTQCTPLSGDVRVDVFSKAKMMMRKEKLFHFWFNTFFVANCVGASRVAPPQDSLNLETFKLTLSKWQLDDAHKDKQHKLYASDFKVELIVQKQPESSRFSAHGARAPSPPSSSDSSCSEPDTEPDAHWDSGEPPPYRRLPQEPRHALCSSPDSPASPADTCHSPADSCHANGCDSHRRTSDSSASSPTDSDHKFGAKTADNGRDCPAEGCLLKPKGFSNEYSIMCVNRNSVKDSSAKVGESVSQDFDTGKISKCETKECNVKNHGNHNHSKKPTSITHSMSADSDDYATFRAVKNDNYTKMRPVNVGSEIFASRPKLGALKSKSVDDHKPGTLKDCSNPSEPIFADKDNYTTLRSVKKSNKETYLVCDPAADSLRVCNAAMAGYVDRFDPCSAGYIRIRDAAEDNAKMFAEAVTDGSGKEFIRFSETQRMTDSGLEEGDVVYRSKISKCPNEECFTLVSGPTSLPDECYSLVEPYKSKTAPGNSKSKKKSSKRDDEKPSEKGKMPKVASDHTILDETKKKNTFFQRRERDEEGSRPRLSLGDMRASWREFSGKWAEHRKKKDRDDS